MKSQSFTKPGEMVFNLVAFFLLYFLVFYSYLAMLESEARSDWQFWILFYSGPLAFWVAVVAIYVRLRRSGYRPKFRYRRQLAFTGSRDCYHAYVQRFGHDALLWTLAIAPVWTLLCFAYPFIAR